MLATTYLDEAERATSVLALDDGRALAEGSVDEIIESMPGALRVRATPPADDDMRARAWRRGSGWRVWYPALTRRRQRGTSGSSRTSRTPSP